jgi:hypothetical protein
MKTLALIAALAAGAFLSTAANANLITVSGTSHSLTCNGATAGQCQGMVGGSLTVSGNAVTGGSAGSFSNTLADLYSIGKSDEANEAAALNVLAGTNFTGTDGVRTPGSGGDMTFSTLALYVVMKLGNEWIFIKNLTGGSLTVAYDAVGGGGFGLSHFTEFGAPQVPLPAAVWLMGAGLAGLGAASRRKATRK